MGTQWLAIFSRLKGMFVMYDLYDIDYRYMLHNTSIYYISSILTLYHRWNVFNLQYYWIRYNVVSVVLYFT